MTVLANVYGTTLIMRPPVPVTCNKAGANYKSEVPHLSYSPRRAYLEWLAIADAILACGGDAIYQFEACDEPYLDHDRLEIDADGTISPHGSKTRLGNLAEIQTGRVFAANGPWVTHHDGHLRAVMPHMLAHRRSELPYYETLLRTVAQESGLALEVVANPHRWEGMADVAVVGEHVVLTYAVPGHYDEATSPKSARSCRDGVAFAADQVGVPVAQRIYCELVYPHFHGDTVHFGVRPVRGAPQLAHYPGGLWRDEGRKLARALGEATILPIEQVDAVEQYAGNSRQVGTGVLVPDGVSEAFVEQLHGLGLTVHRIPLFELFGKAGGGPACATLYLPTTLTLPVASQLRYSQTRHLAHARASRIPLEVSVTPSYFSSKPRG